jgi:AsmA protein
MTFPRLNWKWIGIGVGGALGVVVLAVILFIAFFPTQLAAREAERHIEEATGRDLVLGGDLSVSFWPALGFSAEQASLSNPEGYSTDTPFIAADRIVFAVKLLPLLRGAVEVKQLIFEGAEVNLEARSATEANWTFPTEASQDESETTLEDLRLDDVRLVDGIITFKGADTETPLVLEDVDASIALESLDQPAQLEAAFNYRGERLTVNGEVGEPRAVLEKGETPLTARVESAPLEATFEGGFNAETGRLAGALNASGSSLRRLMAWMGSPMENGGGFGAFRIEGQMAREGDRIDLTDTTLNLDDIQAQGALALITQENGRLKVTGTLEAGELDLNTYLPAPAQGDEAGGVAVDTAWSTAPLDLSGLRAIDADLNLTLAGMRFQRMSFSNVALGLRIANGAADARLSRIALYGGTGTARLIADGSGATPRIAVELNAQNVQAEGLLRDSIGLDKITGRGALRASLVGRGASQAALMRSLNGNAAFNFNDGQWKGLNLGAIARTLQAVATRQAAGQGGATDFSEMSATFAVANGVAATDNLRMMLPAARMEGTGLINIGEQTIDMRLAPRLVNSAQGQGGDATVAGIGIPFRISGPWSRVSFRPALEDVVQNQLRDILSRQSRDGQQSPLGALGDALFGRQPAAQTQEAQGDAEPAPAQPAQQPAQQPAAPRSDEDRARDALGSIFGNAMRGNREDPAPEGSK